MRFTINLLQFLKRLWALGLKELHWELLESDFLVKLIRLYSEHPTSNPLHIPLTTLVKDIFAFLLKECESDPISRRQIETSQYEKAERAEGFLKAGLRYLSRDLVDQYLLMSKKQRTKALYMGFVSQICRVMHAVEAKNHLSLKVDSEWQRICERFFNAEMLKEDQVLVEDPRQPLEDDDNLIDIPPDFKLSNQFMVNKNRRAKKEDYDSLGTALKLKGPRIVKDADSSSSSDDSSDEEALKQYKFVPKIMARGGGNLFQPKMMAQQDQDYAGYDSGGIDAEQLLNEELELEQKRSWLKRDSNKEDLDENVDAYNLVNDWNIYGQGSWKTMSQILPVKSQPQKEEDQPQVKDSPKILIRSLSAPISEKPPQKLGDEKRFKEDEEEKDQDGGLERHSVTADENRKFGLYDSLTRRFQIKKKKRKKKKEPSLENIYDSVGGQGKVMVTR